MTTALGATTSAASGATSTAGTTSAASTQGTSRLAQQLDTPDLFIKLLMAELQHQDPTNPTTPSSILQQTAELSQVEATTTLTTSLKQQRRYVEDSSATGLIGKEVTALVTGRSVTGTVSQISLSSTGTPVLKVGTVTVPFSAVSTVTNASATPVTPATTPTPTTTTSLA